MSVSTISATMKPNDKTLRLTRSFIGKLKGIKTNTTAETQDGK